MGLKVNGIVHSHRKTEKKFLGQPHMFHVCTTGDTAHIDMIFKFLPHTRVNMGTSIFFTAAMIRAFRSARSRGNGGERILCTKCTLHSNHRLTVWYSDTQKTSPPERPFSDYIHSHRLAVEIWTTLKTTYWGENVLSCSFYLYRFRKYVAYGFSHNKFF